MGITERIDRITLLTPESRSATPPVPRSVKIELTARCDFQCFFCASSVRLRDRADIDPAFYRRILKDMRALGVEDHERQGGRLPQGGGEPEGGAPRARRRRLPLRPVCLEHPLRRRAARAHGGGGAAHPALRRRALLAAALRPGRAHQQRARHQGDLTAELEAWHSAAFQALRRANLAEHVRGTVCEKCIAYD